MTFSLFLFRVFWWKPLVEIQALVLPLLLLPEDIS
jgi:hypothetical protein